MEPRALPWFTSVFVIWNLPALYTPCGVGGASVLLWQWLYRGGPIGFSERIRTGACTMWTAIVCADVLVQQLGNRLCLVEQ